MYYRITVEKNMYTQKEVSQTLIQRLASAWTIKPASGSSPRSGWTRSNGDLHVRAENRPIPFASRQ